MVHKTKNLLYSLSTEKWDADASLADLTDKRRFFFFYPRLSVKPVLSLPKYPPHPRSIILLNCKDSLPCFEPCPVFFCIEAFYNSAK